MDCLLWLEKLTLLMLVYATRAMDSDILESFRPKDENAPELNEFLANVLAHRNDFTIIRESAKKYQKMKKDIQDLEPFNFDVDHIAKKQEKRNVHHLTTKAKSIHSNFLPPNLQRKFKKIRKRNIKKRVPQVIMLQSDDYDEIQKRMPSVSDIVGERDRHIPATIFTEDQGEKLEKRTPEIDEEHIPVEIFSEDHGELEKRAPETEEIEVESEGESGRLKSEQKKQVDNEELHHTYKHPLKHERNQVRDNQKGEYYYVDLEEKNREKNNEKRFEHIKYPEGKQIYRHPLSKPNAEHDYQEYETNMHHNLNDEVAFEKALSYEIEPHQIHENVDETREDFVPFKQDHVQVDKTQYDPEIATNERFFVDNDDSFKRIESSTVESTSNSNDNIKKVGDGFIDIAKPKRDEQINDDNEDVEDQEESSVLAKHSLHPLRVRDDNYQSRKLQFFDYEEDNDDEEIPSRPRRDFLDSLGMKNEEDCNEDNPYNDELNVNNTDIHNDTYIHNLTTPHSCSTVKTTTPCHQKEEINNIKQILEDKQFASGEEKKEKHRKRESSERRRSTDIETKILKNKGKIYNHHVQTREQPKWAREMKKTHAVKKSVNHKMHKKEDCEECEEEEETTNGHSCNETKTENNTNSYEHVAEQMDNENEKLAQVVNGHLASQIVTTVFDELKKKSCLKAKFYSGLSRKHINFAGSIDFDIFKANDTQDVDEARFLLDQITKVLNKLVLNQVRRKLCQRLPDELKDFLAALVNAKLDIIHNHFEQNTKQGDYLFKYQEEKAPTAIDTNHLNTVLVELEGLLQKYHGMSSNCQEKAEPVKDYIEHHVKMAKQMVNCPNPQNNCESKKRATGHNKELVEKQLESLGLGRKQEFVPNFDLNQLIRNKMRANGWKSDKKRDLKRSKSEQYQKLQEAAERIREKRENEKKIVELFANKKKRSLSKLDVDYEQPVVFSLG